MPAHETPPRVLVLFAHPALERSRVNRVLVRALLDLERLIREELRDVETSRDAAWDSDSLRREYGQAPRHDLWLE